jgi:hypothetical protein
MSRTYRRRNQHKRYSFRVYGKELTRTLNCNARCNRPECLNRTFVKWDNYTQLHPKIQCNACMIGNIVPLTRSERL